MDVIEFLKYLKFDISGNNATYKLNDYSINIQLDDQIEKSFISYGDKIIVHNKVSSNFSKEENFVVLECVIRLLEKGYKPENIELEKTWKSGHGHSGRLDVLLTDSENKSFSMIECKTYGAEYLNERDNILEDGGQLFTYFINERTTKYLILYASRYLDNKIDTQIEQIEAEFLSGNNQEELFDSWNRNFILDGIFSEIAKPYFSEKEDLKKSDLQKLDRDSGKGLYNSFAEILRRHVVSDKSNAFNKIFNLFVCKIYDEDTKRNDDYLDFQWKVNDNYTTFIERLGKLYIKGVSDYLGIDITENYFSYLSEFAFKDVFNEDSFIENFQIVKEVVELLQIYQLKYTHKQQFLGDFFEKLLNTGIKQESGQFFTPIPLAKFFLRSIPIRDIINDNVISKSINIFPTVIDFACGSGHFLTEAIDEIQEHIDGINHEELVGRIQKQFLSIKEHFIWAKEYIYGIDKDYRLSKTTKIAMFLNGDGDAQIINSDALDDFHKSKYFKGLLKNSEKNKCNEKFDILVSNPPFSISSFYNYIYNANQNFYLSKYSSSKSTEIECFFIERMYQLLKEEYFGGIILPLSILNSTNALYITSRIILLLLFKIKGIIELRDKTFIATNTTTVGVFIQKRSISNIISELKKYTKENKIKFPFSNDNIDYFDLLNLSNHEFFYDFLKSINNSDVVLAYTGEKKEQEHFLGYRFSNSRGKEGIEFLYDDESVLNTKLFNEIDYNDDSKVDYYIRNNFKDTIINNINENLSDNMCYKKLSDLISDENKFVIENPSSYFISSNYIIESHSIFGDFIDNFKLKKYDFGKLIDSGDVKYLGGLVYDKKSEVPYKTNKKVFTASNIEIKDASLIFNKIIYLKEDYNLPVEIQPKPGDIIISTSSGSLKHLGKCTFINEELKNFAIGGFLSILRFKDSKLAKAFYYRLLSLEFRKYISTLRDQNINNLSAGELKKFTFKIPDNLDEFYKDAIKKEKEYTEVQKKLKSWKES